MRRSACFAASASALVFAALNVGVAAAQSHVRQRALPIIPVGPMSSQAGGTRIVFSSPSVAVSSIDKSAEAEETARAAGAPAAGMLAGNSPKAAEVEKPAKGQAYGEVNAAKPVARPAVEQKPLETRPSDRSVAASRSAGEARGAANSRQPDAAPVVVVEQAPLQEKGANTKQLPRMQPERPNQGRWTSYLQSMERR